MDESLGRTGSGLAGAGWKIGAASDEIRQAERLPSPSPGIIYAHTIFPNGARMPAELFINYRCCECEFAFRLARDFPVRAEPYTEADARARIDCLFPACLTPCFLTPCWPGRGADAVDGVYLGYLRALREPLPGLRAVVSGGIAAAEVPGYLAAGAHAVCLGGALIDRTAARRGDVDAVAATPGGYSTRSRRRTSMLMITELLTPTPGPLWRLVKQLPFQYGNGAALRQRNRMKPDIQGVRAQ